MMKFGISFSHRQVKHLGYEVDEALQKALELKLDYLRIGVYWDEVEPTEGKFIWHSVTNIIDVCEKQQQKVVLTLGVKAPRYPEFHYPSWLEYKDPHNIQTQRKILTLIEKTLRKTQNYTCISHYQIENEALDPSGEQQQIIPLDFLKKEVQLVKKLSSKPIITSLWGNNLSQRKLLSPLVSISDIVGIDLYYQQFISKVLNESFYKGPTDKPTKLKKLLNQASTEKWIMELQAEPWEADEAAYLSKTPDSISPQQLLKNYQKASQLPITTIMFWGFEYWFYQLKQYQNDEYFQVVQSIMQNE